MNRRKSILIVAAAFVAGLAAAFVTGNADGPGAGLLGGNEARITLPPSKGLLSRDAAGNIDPGAHPDFSAILRGRAVLSLLGSTPAERLPGSFARARADTLEARLVAKRWAETDPEAFLAYLDRYPEGDPVGLDSRQVLFETWTANDPAAALAAADASVAHKRDSLKAVFATLMHVDPEAGFQYIAEHPDQYIPIDFSALGWTEENSEQHVRRLAELPEWNNFRRLALRYAAQAWRRQNPSAALDFLAGLGNDPSHARPGALNEWSAEDPVAASEYIANEVMGSDRYIAANGVVINWAKIDPQATMEWIEANLWGVSRRNATKLLLTEVAGYNPDAVLEFLGEMPPTISRRDGYAALARTWIKSDSEAAFAWAHSIESSSEKSRIFNALADGVTNGGPWKEAGKYVVGHADPATIPTSFTAAIGEKWGSHFPFEALGWVKTLPPEHAGAASRAVFDAWTRRNVGPVVNPVKGLPAGEIRANAHAAVAANYFRGRNFEKAAGWFRTLGHEDQQAALSGLSSSVRKRLESLPANE